MRPILYACVFGNVLPEVLLCKSYLCDFCLSFVIKDQRFMIIIFTRLYTGVQIKMCN